MNQYATNMGFEWPQSLLCEVLGSDYFINNLLPFDIEESIYYVLKSLRNDTLISVIFMRYKDTAKLQEISELLNITFAQAKAQEVLALRKLRREKNRNILRLGLNEWRRKEKVAVEDPEKWEKEWMETLPAKVGDGNASIILRLRKTYNSNHIRILDFEPRVNNALTRAGIETIDELCTYSCRELKEVRNLGVKSFREVEAALEKYGLQLQGTEAEETVAQNDAALQEVLLDDQTWKASLATKVGESTAVALIKIKEAYGTTNICSLKFNARVINACFRANIRDLELLCSYSPKQLANIRNLGIGSVAHVDSILKEHGLHLRISD